jgi:ATP-dependent Clp protease ATP-binding subunit ClpB
MAFDLPERLWRTERKQVPQGAGQMAPQRRKAVEKMVRLNVPLDPGKTGRDAAQLENGLNRMIIGQDEAIQQIVNIYQMHLTGMAAPGRPIGNFLFLGPTGSGKTRIVEATAEVLLKNPRAVIKIDCAEFQHSHEIAKLIGSPPGYLGHRETHALLSQEILNQYHTDTVKISFVLFDEIEKASDALWNLLLGILDKGTLTLGDNRRVDFSRAMIFMTSNLGATEMGSIMKPHLGFAAGEIERRHSEGRVDENLNDKVSRAGVEAARRKFTPEFMNRIDKVVSFRPLGSEQLYRILSLELNMLQQRIFNSANTTPFVLNLASEAKDYLLREGTDLKYGARHLKRAIDRALVHPLSNLIASDQIRGGDLVEIDYDSDLGSLAFVKQAENMPVYAMMQMADRPLAMQPGAAVASAPVGKVANTKSHRSR